VEESCVFHIRAVPGRIPFVFADTLQAALWRRHQQNSGVASQPICRIGVAALRWPTPGLGRLHGVYLDSRALTVQPSEFAVRSVPDAPGHPGIIQCGSITGYCYAYLDNEHTIIVPDYKPTNMGPYQMETVILWELGYDVSGR